MLSKSLTRPVTSVMRHRSLSTGGFKFLEEMQVTKETPQFTVGRKNGFLPREEPLDVLPSRFDKLESLLQRMPLKMKNGKPGLCAAGEFGDAVLRELPLIDVSDVSDSRLLTALFRDYSFVASSYLLEPCDLSVRKTGQYGLGRQVLPKNIAVPFVQIAEKMKAKPFMEYALSYALANYKRKDPSKGLVFDNLDLIRMFEGSESEFGFIAVHVTMVSHTGHLVSAVADVLSAAAKKDTKQLNDALIGLRKVMAAINLEMDTMWERSKHQDYKNFRTFIMGIKNQPMFPNGVVYEGVSPEPRQYRGESGANDSIIPTCDNLLQVTQQMPSNPLTETLMDFRSYRPSNHSQWVQYVLDEAARCNVRAQALSNSTSAVLYQACVDQIREFRHRHWNFTKEYIIKHTDHPVATGGSPIITWLPNQLSAVLEAMENVAKVVKPSELSDDLRQLHQELNRRASVEAKILKREVEVLSQMKLERRTKGVVESA